MLRLLLRCDSPEDRNFAVREAMGRGLHPTLLRGRIAGTIVLGVPREQYPAVLAWWKEGGRLIRTLGPEDVT